MNKTRESFTAVACAGLLAAGAASFASDRPWAPLGIFMMTFILAAAVRGIKNDHDPKDPL